MLYSKIVMNLKSSSAMKSIASSDDPQPVHQAVSAWNWWRWADDTKSKYHVQ